MNFETQILKQRAKKGTSAIMQLYLQVELMVDRCNTLLHVC